MALGLSGSFVIDVRAVGKYQSANALDPALVSLAEAFTHTFTGGTGVNQANRLYYDQRTLVSTSEDLDFSGGVTDEYGNTITLAEIKAIIIRNRSTTSGQHVTVGGDANAILIGGAASHTQIIGPSGIYVLTSPIDGITVTATTGDILKVATDATITYDIIVLGSTA